MGLRIFKTCLVVFVVYGCIHSSESNKDYEEHDLSDILRKQAGLKVTKLPENMYKYGDAPVVAVVRSKPSNLRRDVTHMDPYKAMKRVVGPVCPLPAIKSHIADPLISAKQKLDSSLNNLERSHLDTQFVEEEPECLHKHEADVKDLKVKAPENKNCNKNDLAENKINESKSKTLSVGTEKHVDETNSSTCNDKTVFFEEPAADLKHSLKVTSDVIKNEVLEGKADASQHHSLETPPIKSNRVCCVQSNYTVTKTENNSSFINPAKTNIILPKNNTNPEIYEEKPTNVQDEGKISTSSGCKHDSKTTKQPTEPISEPQIDIKINSPITSKVNDITCDECGNSHSTNNNLSPNTINTNIVQQGDNGLCQEDNQVEEDVGNIVIDNQDINEVIETYKYPYNFGCNTGYNYNMNNGLSNQGGMYNMYYQGNCYPQNQQGVQEYPNYIPMQYYTNFQQPGEYKYGLNAETKQTYSSKHLPDYTLVPPPFKYPSENQWNYNNAFTSANGIITNQYNTYTNKDITKYNFNTPNYNNLWCQQESTKTKNIYNTYDWQTPQNWEYRQGYYPNRFVDRILRSWRRTSITMKPEKNKSNPCQIRLSQDGRNINKTPAPLSNFNVRKGLIDRNGYYRNQNTLA